jgi:hypothetical protein
LLQSTHFVNNIQNDFSNAQTIESDMDEFNNEKKGIKDTIKTARIKMLFNKDCNNKFGSDWTSKNQESSGTAIDVTRNSNKKASDGSISNLSNMLIKKKSTYLVGTNLSK